MRYAIYAMPSTDSALWRLGSSILGYDAVTGLDVPFPEHALYHDPLSLAWSANPRQYGFHATLKAPFHLADGRSEASLAAEIEAFCKRQAAFSLDLSLAVVGHFLALIPVDPPQVLQELADGCVRHFDPFRAPMTPEDRERRHPETLIQRQVEHLDTWGYPFVLEDFMFHMTLTGTLNHDDRARVEPVLRELLATIPLSMTIDGLALCRQVDQESRFIVINRFGFGP